MTTRRFILHQENGVSATITTDESALDGHRRERREAALKDGDRIRLVGLAQSVGGYDDRPNLPPGTEGVITADAAGRITDDIGQLYVRWDNGSTLNANPDDRVVKVDDPDATPL